MASVTMQRDLVVNLKRETCLNVGLLSKLQPMPADLSRQIFKENALEKPTQNVFNNLSYYLVSIIDPQVSDKFSWPLYDTKTERAYRGQLSSFINDYTAKGLLSSVMSSYLVNPGCYKVVMLVFQMSQLAVKRLLQYKMSNKQKELYNSMTDKYNTNNESFIEDIGKETDTMLGKFSNYLRKRNAMEKIAKMFREKIVSMEEKLESAGTQKFITELVEKYVSNHELDDATKLEILKIKNVNTPAPFFDVWLSETDERIKHLESKWDEKVTPFINICTETHENTEALIARHTGEADRNSYVVEYNAATDEIDTKELESQVNSQQKYVLKNIVRNDRLYFPNLVRSFLISICYILKNAEIGDEIYKFNEYLENGKRNFGEMVSAFRILNDRVMNAESKVQPSPSQLDQSTISIKDFEIPPLPDLSDLKSCRDHASIMFDTFTPMSMSKRQFNLRRKHNSFSSFSRPQPKSLVTPFHQGPRDDFLKSLISCRVSTYDRPDVSQNFHNLSVISTVNSRGNETIAECSGFSKQQIMRLLSTKKSSSSKKFKNKTERPNINVKKGGLFNDSINNRQYYDATTSNDGTVLFRSRSSPNLFENRDKKSFTKLQRRKLSIMQEDSPALLEVSGIVALEKDNTYGTPEGITGLEKSRIVMDTISLPVICITPEPDIQTNTSKEKKFDFDKAIESKLDALKDPRKSHETKVDEVKTETPKNTVQISRKTSSLEKIINRFKKVRANVLSTDSIEENGEFKTIVEEKENFNVVNVDVFAANKILLPDLLSPSCSVLSIKSTDYLDQLCMDLDDKERKKPRESLGTALGVDNTFLDQFDLID